MNETPVICFCCDLVLEWSVLGNIVTTEAFGFLDGYSDGEGTDFMGSGQITPTQARGKFSSADLFARTCNCNMPVSA